jgi:hypothetical protein
MIPFSVRIESREGVLPDPDRQMQEAITQMRAELHMARLTGTVLDLVELAKRQTAITTRWQALCLETLTHLERKTGGLGEAAS